MNRKPLFLDRDGVLNEDIKPYVSHRDKFKLFPYTIDALAALNEAGFDLYVVSNQQGVSLGITPPIELAAIVEMIQSSVRPCGFEIRKFYHCTAKDSENHPWRKPSPGMILSAAEEFGFDPRGAFLIGDKWSDIEAAGKAGCRGLLVMSGVTSDDSYRDWAYPPEKVFPNLLEAAKWVVQASADAD
ncbi:MAG: HAD family hydrolase [Fimbriimonadaceae bacterium]